MVRMERENRTHGWVIAYVRTRNLLTLYRWERPSEIGNTHYLNTNVATRKWRDIVSAKWHKLRVECNRAWNVRFITPDTPPSLIIQLETQKCVCHFPHIAA